MRRRQRTGTHWKAGALQLERTSSATIFARLPTALSLQGLDSGPLRRSRGSAVRLRARRCGLAPADARQPGVLLSTPRSRAVLLCDDYACTTCPGATEAIDRFLGDKPEKMVSLDAGGGSSSREYRRRRHRRRSHDGTAKSDDRRGTTWEHEVQSGERFGFGANWAAFLRVLNDERIRAAEDSLKKMLDVDRLDGKRFLDAGSGSGLFSLAAVR